VRFTLSIVELLPLLEARRLSARESLVHQ
jgi:hypothetical protein